MSARLQLKRASMPLELPADKRTLVLQNASGLHRQEQAALWRWRDADRQQVVSTTVDPLFPLTASGLFDEALYYRLNALLVNIGSPVARG